MKLRNRKTGEIVNLTFLEIPKSMGQNIYNSLTELNKDWEDALEEPKVYYYISDFGAIRECEIGKFPEDEENRKRIGNYFDTREEVEKAVEKLKAWRRLKDSGFGFRGFYKISDSRRAIEFRHTTAHKGFGEDFHLLFGGEK